VSFQFQIHITFEFKTVKINKIVKDTIFNSQKCFNEFRNFFGFYTKKNKIKSLPKSIQSKILIINIKGCHFARLICSQKKIESSFISIYKEIASY